MTTTIETTIQKTGMATTVVKPKTVTISQNLGILLTSLSEDDRKNVDIEASKKSFEDSLYWGLVRLPVTSGKNFPHHDIVIDWTSDDPRITCESVSADDAEIIIGAVLKVSNQVRSEGSFLITRR